MKELLLNTVCATSMTFCNLKAYSINLFPDDKDLLILFFAFDILLVLFAYNTIKQFYASRHFTGANYIMPKVLLVVAIINTLILVTDLICLAILGHIVHTIVIIIIIGIMSIILLYNNNADYRKQVKSTVIATIGIIVNIVILIVDIICFVLLNK